MQRNSFNSLALIFFYIFNCVVLAVSDDNGLALNGDSPDTSKVRPHSFLSLLTGQMSISGQNDSETDNSNEVAEPIHGRQFDLNPPSNVDPTPGPFIYDMIQSMNPFTQLFQSKRENPSPNQLDQNDINPKFQPMLNDQTPIVIVIPVPIDPTEGSTFNNPFVRSSMYGGDQNGMYDPPRGMMPFGPNYQQMPYGLNPVGLAPSEMPPVPFIPPPAKRFMGARNGPDPRAFNFPNGMSRRNMAENDYGAMPYNPYPAFLFR